jgi:hypothetical protein
VIFNQKSFFALTKVNAAFLKRKRELALLDFIEFEAACLATAPNGIFEN